MQGVPLGASCHWLPSSHVPVVDVCLQVPLRQVGSFAALHDAAHEERSSQALLNTLDWVIAARAHFVTLLLVDNSTFITENVFTWNHASVYLYRKTAFVTEMNRCVIFFSNQIYLTIPEYFNWKSSFSSKHFSAFALIPLFLIVTKTFFIHILWFGRYSVHVSWRPGSGFVSDDLLVDQL